MRTTAFILLMLLVPACAEPEREAETGTDALAENDARIRGTFRPKSDPASADIQLLDFDDDARYQLVPRGCADAACVEAGSFAVDREHDRLELDPDGDRSPYSLPLVIRETRAAASLRPADLVSGGSEGALVEEGSAPLVSGVELVGREYELVASTKNRKSHAGSASQLNATLDEAQLRKTSQQRALANCTDAQTEVPANGVNHCNPGDYIWGNRIIKTVAATACEPGYVYTTCTTIITVTTTTID